MVSAMTGCNEDDGDEDVEGAMQRGAKTSRYSPFFSRLSAVSLLCLLFFDGISRKGCGFGERSLLEVRDSSKFGFGNKAEGWVLMVRQMW